MGNQPIVHKWWRENGKRKHEEYADKEPFFFVEKNAHVPDDHRVKRVETDGDWESFDHIPLKKVVAHNPKHVGGYGGLKNEFAQTWESDVYFRTRYWLDEIDIDNDEQFLNREYRTLMYDLEVDHSLDYVNAPEEIISVTAYDTGIDKYVSFMLTPHGRTVEGFKNDNWSLYTYDPDDYEESSKFTAMERAEREMILDFFDLVDDCDPDIISAWNGAGYDDPYLINRCSRLNIDYTQLSPINDVKLIDDGKRVQMKGRELIDMIPAFKKSYPPELNSYRLNDVGKDLLGKEKIKFEGTGAQLWRDDPKKLIEYNRRDVEIMVELDEQFDVWGMLREVQGWVGINLEDILHNSRVTQAYFSRNMEGRMPPKGYDEDAEGFQGATVLDQTPGLSENVAVLDLKAQYPSAMISYNMSPETKIPSGMSDSEIAEQFIDPMLLDMTDTEIVEKFKADPDELREVVRTTEPENEELLSRVVDDNTITVGTGARFWYGEQGVIPSVLIEMIQERDKHKELRDEAEPGSDVYERHDRRQYSLKFVINSVYGVMGFPQFPLYDRDIAASTTYVGRQSIMKAKEAAQDLGYVVTYGDTDSIMLGMGEDITTDQAIDKSLKLETFVNERYDEYAKEEGIDTSRFEGIEKDHFLEIEAEKLYKRFFMINAQKKYAGHIVWKEGKKVDDYDYAQFGLRSSNAKVSNDVVQRVLQMILEGKSQDQIQSYVTNVCNKISNGEYDLDYIGIPSRMKKELDDYKADRPILRGVKFTNQYLAEEFGKGDKPKYVYVKSTPPGMPSTDAVAFSQATLPNKLVVDYDKMVRKDIKQKLRKILNTMDWPWESIYRRSGSLLDF